MNMADLLYKNIIQSDYFKQTLSKYETFEEVVDEIYNYVDHLEPCVYSTHPSLEFGRLA